MDQGKIRSIVAGAGIKAVCMRVDVRTQTSNVLQTPLLMHRMDITGPEAVSNSESVTPKAG